MQRRQFITTLGAAVVLARPVRAQQANGRPLICILSPISAAAEARTIGAFRTGLRELGYEDSRNIAIETRFADGAVGRLQQLANELVALKPEVLVAGSNPGVQAAKRATGTIPIVMVTTGDPIAGGLVKSLARPGGNVTGVTTIAQELSSKRLELLKEAMPGLMRVAVLANPDSLYTELLLKDASSAAKAMSMELQILQARGPREFDAAFAAMRGSGAQALMVLTDIMFFTEQARIVELAAASRLPTMYWERAFVSAGGLMFYGSGLSDMYRHAATHVDRILKGAKPGDLPVEQPTKLELVINLKAAKALGLTIPPILLVRADEVIE